MGHLQLIASFIGFENGVDRGVHDFKIESAGKKGSIETLTVGCDETIIELPSGLGKIMSMNSQQAFQALTHVQNRTRALEEAFGADIEPPCDGIQVQGVLAMLNPTAFLRSDDYPCNCPNGAVEKMAFMFRDGYLMLSTLGPDGVWHSDARKVKEALEGFSFTDLMKIICKIMGTLSVWSWALWLLCSTLTTGTGAILCALAIIAAELISIAAVIAIIEEVTGKRIRIAAFQQAKKQFHEGQLASAREALDTARPETLEVLAKEFKNEYKPLATWLTEQMDVTFCHDPRTI